MQLFTLWYYILTVLFKKGLQRTYSQKATTAFSLMKHKVLKAKFDQDFTIDENTNITF